MSDGGGPPPLAMTPEDALARYETLRDRLPAATFPAVPRQAAHLGGADFDAFVLDAFGVLNVGEIPVPGAVARMAALRAAGKRLVVLTNAASYPRAEAVAKFRRLGFDFTAAEIVSSRDVAAAALDRLHPGIVWAAISAAGDSFADIPAPAESLIDDPAALDRAGGVLFLSSARWDWPRQEALVRALRRRPLPLVVANPDLVAPREGGLTVEPGAWAHDIQDRTGIVPAFFGKPFADAFDAAAARLAGMPRTRIAMVGDTLHTDILGGRAAGFGTVLVTGHGVLKGRDAAAAIRTTGIVPDLILPTT